LKHVPRGVDINIEEALYRPIVNFAIVAQMLDHLAVYLIVGAAVISHRAS
jgi:hypothetical protein